MNGLTVTIEQEFIDYRNKLYSEGSNWSSLENMDSLLLEWWLIKYTFVTPPNNWRHDIIVGNHYIDFKEISGNWWTVKDISKSRMIESVNRGELTDYLFYSTQRTSTTLLKAGDQVKFKFEAFTEAHYALATCSNIGKYNKNETYCSLASLQVA